MRNENPRVCQGKRNDIWFVGLKIQTTLTNLWYTKNAMYSSVLFPTLESLVGRDYEPVRTSKYIRSSPFSNSRV
jgi:hypothetical protein